MFALVPGQLAEPATASGAGVARLKKWFYVEIIAHEKSAEVLVSGNKVMTLTNADFPATEGVLSLWNNGGQGSVIGFRNIEIKELPPEK